MAGAGVPLVEVICQPLNRDYRKEEEKEENADKRVERDNDRKQDGEEDDVPIMTKRGVDKQIEGYLIGQGPRVKGRGHRESETGDGGVRVERGGMGEVSALHDQSRPYTRNGVLILTGMRTCLFWFGVLRGLVPFTTTPTPIAA